MRCGISGLAKLIGEDEIKLVVADRLDAAAVLPFDRCCGVRVDMEMAHVIGFRGFEPWPAIDHRQRGGDADRAPVRRDVLPAEAEELAAPHARAQRDRPEIVVRIVAREAQNERTCAASPTYMALTRNHYSGWTNPKPRTVSV
jgi:hypothetical protein